MYDKKSKQVKFIKHLLIKNKSVIKKVSKYNKRMNLNLALSPSKSTRSLNVSHISPYQPQQRQNTQTYTFECQSQNIEYYQHKNPKKSQNEHNRQQTRKQKLDQDTEYSQQKQHIQKQYKMRMQSMIKGYQMKIHRQQETFELKQMKYMEEIQYLKRQIKQLTNITYTARQQNTDQHCSLCSNGEILKFMKNMLEAVENDHKSCLQEKSGASNKILGLEQKVYILETQLEESEKRCNKLKGQNKQLKSQKEAWDRQKRQKQREFRQIQRQYQTKQMGFQQQCAKQRLMQKQLQSEIKKMQYQHIEAVAIMRQQSKIQLQNQIKRVQQQGQRRIEQSRKQSQDPRQVRRQSLGKQRGNRFQYQYQNIQKEPQGYYNQPELPNPHDPASYTNRRSLISLSVLNPAPSSQNLKPRVNSNSYWKPKYEQSYADYANSKRKVKKNMVDNSFYEKENNFDTFRPRGSYLSSK